MKLNPDCVRDILLEVENASTFSSGLRLDVDNGGSLFDKYTWLEITYHVNQCLMSNLITSAMIFESDEYADIEDLTPAGHKFLANIRDNNVWSKVKTIASRIGSTSLNALEEVAGNVISTLILSYFK